MVDFTRSYLKQGLYSDVANNYENTALLPTSKQGTSKFGLVPHKPGTFQQQALVALVSTTQWPVAKDAGSFMLPSDQQSKAYQKPLQPLRITFLAHVHSSLKQNDLDVYQAQ